jgi:hypothetical protein
MGFAPSSSILPLPAMEDSDQCFDTNASASSISTFSDDSSIVSDAAVDEVTDPSCLSRKRRRYRTEYLQYKRMRAAGNEDVLPPVRTFPVLPSVTAVTAAAVLFEDSSALSKEMKRKIANRESARRSREAVDLAIQTAEREIKIEEQTRLSLENELNFLHLLAVEGPVVAEPSAVVDSADDLFMELLDETDDWSSSISCSSGDCAMDVDSSLPCWDHFDEQDMMQLLATW